jgi:hypothetical protein
MWGTEIGSGDNVPFAVVPDRPQRCEDCTERAASIIREKAGGVFSHKQLWAESCNNSQTFAPEPSLIGFTLSFPGHAHRLARRPSADDIDSPILVIVWRERRHVAPSVCIGPMLRKDAVGVLVDFDLPLADHPCPLKAQVESADARKQRAECQWLSFHSPSLRASSNLSMPFPDRL